jgi:hypothetical protein
VATFPVRTSGTAAAPDLHAAHTQGARSFRERAPNAATRAPTKHPGVRAAAAIGAGPNGTGPAPPARSRACSRSFMPWRRPRRLPRLIVRMRKGAKEHPERLQAPTPFANESTVFTASSVWPREGRGGGLPGQWMHQVAGNRRRMLSPDWLEARSIEILTPACRPHQRLSPDATCRAPSVRTFQFRYPPATP